MRYKCQYSNASAVSRRCSFTPQLRKDIMTLLLKDFGVRSKVRQLDIETRRMTQDDRNQFLAIAEKYGITAAEAEFPAWLIDFERQSTSRGGLCSPSPPQTPSTRPLSPTRNSAGSIRITLSQHATSFTRR